MSAVHGTALGVALDEEGPLRGVLLIGPAGCGKSQLAAELIAHCPYHRTGLIADDLVDFDRSGWAETPAAGALLHLRGMGIAEVRQAPPMGIDFIVRLGPTEQVDSSDPRLASANEVPVDPGEVTAAKLRLALQSLASGHSLWCGFEPGPDPHQE